MKASGFIVAAVALVCLSATGVSGQSDALFQNLHRMDFRDLGQRGSNLIEPDDSKITSLATDRATGRIYGATSGKRAQIFAFEPATNHLRPLGVLPGAGGVHNAVVTGRNGLVYFGTGRDMTADQPLSRDWGSELGHNHIAKKMWADILAFYDGYSGGHIYRFDPKDWDKTSYQANRPAIVEDLGIPVPGEGIYCLAGGLYGKRLYGVTYPHGKFFAFDVETRQTEIIGETWKEVVFAGPRRALRSLPGALIRISSERYLYSTDGGRLAFYKPRSKKLVVTDQRIPGEFYPFHHDGDVYHPVVETWAGDPRDAEVYGGTNDGYLFRVNGNLNVTNLGKPRITRRIRALALATDGRVYGIAGENKVGCTLFCYDPRGGGFTHFGPIDVDESPYYAWRPLRFGAMATGLDGTLYLGEEDRRGHLFLIIPPLRPPAE